MKRSFMNWVAMAEAAEARGDWADAKRCWYYAAQHQHSGDLRAVYNAREDAAEQRRRQDRRHEAHT